MYNYFVKGVFFFAIFFSTSSLQLIIDGGAREEGVQLFAQGGGVLDFVKPFWLLMATLVAARYIFVTRRLSFSQSEKWLLLMVLYFCVGLIWSDVFFMAAKLVSAIAASVFVVLSFVSRFGTAGSVIFAGRSLSCILFISILVSLFLPSYGVAIGRHEGAWQGIFTHKNDLGSFSLLAVCFFLGFSRYFKKGFLFASLISAFVLSYMSTSVASVVGVGFIFSVVVLLKFSPLLLSLLHSLRKGVFFGVLLLSILPIALYFISINIELFGRDATFSGRGVIWEYFGAKILENPFFGYGFNQFNAASNFSAHSAYRVLGFTPGSAHNGILDSLLSIGVVGGVLFCRVLFFYSCAKVEMFYSAFIFLIGLSIINGTEAQLVYFNAWFLFFVFYFAVIQNGGGVYASEKSRV